MQTVGLRAYLTAHAPEEPHAWFVPHMQNECPDNLAEKLAWYVEKEKQRLVQWPLAWADEQIKLLGDDVEITYFKKG